MSISFLAFSRREAARALDRIRRITLIRTTSAAGAAACVLGLTLCLPGVARAQLVVRDGELTDGLGRTVMFRGVNLPWGLRVPGVADKPAVPADEDAVQIAALGFNVVRLQLSWKAIEPGKAGPNDPAICAPGPPGDPGQWDERHAQAYLDRVQAVVDALERRHVMTLFQIAQYGYNDRFGGPPSSPDWAVCTDRLPITAGRGAGAYAQPGVSAAADHFWNNDVRGNLQGEYDRVLHALAQRFARDPAVAGYELYNEPFLPTAVVPKVGGFDALVQCFYAGSRDPGRLADGSRPACPAGVPAAGAIEAVRSADPDSVIHVQPPIFSNFGVPSAMGPLPAANLVFNFHVYCSSEVVTQPQRIRDPGCQQEEERAVEQADGTRHAMASAREAGALAWFLSEFGYTGNEQTLRHMTELADRRDLGWTYFLWRADTGFATSDNPGMLRAPAGTLRPFARILARPYPAALAGSAEGMSYDPDRRTYDLAYRPRGNQPSEIVLPRFTYATTGACPSVVGGDWRIAGDRLVVFAASSSRKVVVRLRPGACGRQSRRCAPGGRFMIRLRQERRDPLLRARVRVAGRRVRPRQRAGRMVVVVDLRRSRLGSTPVVRSVGRTRSGRIVHERRTYRVCR